MKPARRLVGAVVFTKFSVTEVGTEEQTTEESLPMPPYKFPLFPPPPTTDIGIAFDDDFDDDKRLKVERGGDEDDEEKEEEEEGKELAAEKQ